MESVSAGSLFFTGPGGTQGTEVEYPIAAISRRANTNTTTHLTTTARITLGSHEKWRPEGDSAAPTPLPPKAITRPANSHPAVAE